MSTKPKVTLCERCQQPFHGDIAKKNIVFFDHYQTWNEVNAAAEDGCYMCSWYIQKWPTSQKASINGDTSLRMMCGIFPPDKMSIGLIRKDLAALNFDCYRKDEDIASAVGGWDPPMNVGREHLSSLLSPWHRDCKTQHAECASHTRPYIPSRLLLLELGGLRPFVRLLQGADLQNTADLVYCTVSHRWGDANLPKLQSTTMPLLESGIPIADLPANYQEAIVIAETLSIKYVWIDSLCIIQDSDLDWRHEAAAMCEIYRGAEFNIALAAAAGDSGAAMTERDTSLLRVASHQLPRGDGGDDERDWIIVSHEMGKRDLDHSEFIKRAWILQELRLATRTVFLGAEQVFYVCRHGTCCETFQGGIPPEKKDRHWWLNNMASGTHKLWETLVRYYSGCDITYPSDRTMAIAGLARWYTEQLDDEYVAGMWRSRFPGCLLWTVDNYHATKRADPYRAPTWSWLSVEGPVWASDGHEPSSNLCDLISSTIDLVDAHDPYGQITNGEIVLHGHLIPVALWGKGQAAAMATPYCCKVQARGVAEPWRSSGKLEVVDEFHSSETDPHNRTSILSRDEQSGPDKESGRCEFDFDDIPMKPDGSMHSPLTVQFVAKVDGEYCYKDYLVHRYVTGYALPFKESRLGSSGSRVEGLLLRSTTERGGGFERFGRFSIDDPMEYLTTPERCNVRIV